MNEYQAISRLCAFGVAALCLFSARVARTDDVLDIETGGATVRQCTVAWEFSVDGGRTYASSLPANLGAKKALYARGTFNVDDPAALAFLWLAFDDTNNLSAFCPDDLDQEQGGRNYGSLPLWAHAGVTLNGRLATGPLDPMLYRMLPVDPKGLVTRGTNTVVLSGTWEASGSSAFPVRPLKLLAAAPQAANIRSGPVLGMIGPDYFTVTCRTALPASITVTATPIDAVTRSDGANTAAVATATSQEGLYHRLKVPLASGTRRFKYTVTSKAGKFEMSKGPYEARVPDGKDFRFIAIGNTACSSSSYDVCPPLVEQMVKADPDLFFHAGHVVELAAWDFHWDKYFLGRYGRLLSTVPTYLSPAAGDHVGLAYATFYTPGEEGNVLYNWTEVVGDVRFISLDGYYGVSARAENAEWLESVLTDATEKFIFVFNHPPAFTSGVTTNLDMQPLRNAREVLMPLMARYKATAMISAFDFDYERCEAAAPAGVTSIVVGSGGSKLLGRSPNAATNNPLAGTGPFVSEHAFAVFTVKGDTCDMKAIDIKGRQIDQRTFKARRP